MMIGIDDADADDDDDGDDDDENEDDDDDGDGDNGDDDDLSCLTSAGYGTCDAGPKPTWFNHVRINRAYQATPVSVSFGTTLRGWTSLRRWRSQYHPPANTAMHAA